MPTQIVSPRIPFVDPNTGTISREWNLFLLSMFNQLGGTDTNYDLTELQAQVQQRLPAVNPPQEIYPERKPDLDEIKRRLTQIETYLGI